MKIKLLTFLLLCIPVYSFKTTNMLAMKINKSIDMKTKPKHVNNFYKPNKLNSYLKITRPEGLPCEFAMPLFGSYLATKSLSVIINPYALLMCIISAIVASNSMVINDYYDYKLGTDNEKKNKVLNNNELTSEEVLYFSTYLVITSYYLCSLIANNMVRDIISNTIIFTYLYTPVFKNIPLIKNIIVALIITQAPLTGAIIVGGNYHNVIPTIIYLFNFIMWQEIMLDIMDINGDKKNNINTIPVLYGYKKANMIGLGFLLLGSLIPYGLSISFIIIQLPLILINTYAITKDKILKKTTINLSKIIMLISGIYMCNI